MRLLVFALVGSGLLLVGGVLIATMSTGIGVGLAVTGAIGFGVIVVYSNLRAASNNPGAAYVPGKAHREMRKEREAAERAARKRP